MIQKFLKILSSPFQKKWESGFDAGYKVGKLLGSEAERLALLNLINRLTEKEPDQILAEYPLVMRIYEIVKSGDYNAS